MKDFLPNYNRTTQELVKELTMVGIRQATTLDLDEILDLGKKFGHLMLYQKSPDLMESYLPRILVAESQNFKPDPGTVGILPNFKVLGYYHYIVSGDPGFKEMLQVYRQLPSQLVAEASDFAKGKLCICMQGASHREVFSEFILFLQDKYPNIWCYTSEKSGRRDSYEALGFGFRPENYSTFWNCSKGDYSTYQLGRWHRSGGLGELVEYIVH